MATSSAMSTTNDKIKYKVTITQNSQSVANNTSNVTVSVRVYRTNTGYTTYGTGTVYCTINGTQYTESITSSDKITNSGIVVFSKTLNIAHSADGSKTLATSTRITHDQFSSSAQGYSQPLTTIPRATTPTLSASSVNMGASITINMPRASSSFDHTLTYKFGSATGTIGSDLGTSKAWTVPLSLASQVPNGTSGTCTITCKTYNGSTLIGTKTVSFTAKVPSSVVPSISSLTVAEAVSGLAAQFGAYIQNKSKLKVTISASGSYSSTIKSYKTTISGKSYSGSSFTSGVLTASGTVTISTTVTDSRGRTATKSSTVSVVAYTAPKISTFTAVRANGLGTADDEGTMALARINFAIASVGEKNAKSYVVEYKLKSSDTWTEAAKGSVYSYNSNMLLNIDLDTDSSYDLRLSITDYFSEDNPVRAFAEIATAFTLLDFNASGKGIAFGKVSEIADQMEINMDMDIHKNIFMGGAKRSNDEKNMYFQTTEDSEFVHNCKLYGANGASVTSIGCWDSARAHGIWRYLSSTQNLVFDANVKVTRANGGDEFVTSEPVVHGSRTGRCHFSNGLLIQWGVETITPVANTPTAKAVKFPVAYTSIPMVLTTAITTVPGTSVTGDASANITATGFDAYVTRTGTTNTSVGWVAIGYKA
ncbi:MAG: hypothetical protein IJZ23_06830 [Roseburia sp.]|nr:hypothetical protein [Roseburia sp.]MBQ8279539.1 hypothetical protein [Roseburia sp.]